MVGARARALSGSRPALPADHQAARHPRVSIARKRLHFPSARRARVAKTLTQCLSRRHEVAKFCSVLDCFSPDRSRAEQRHCISGARTKRKCDSPLQVYAGSSFCGSCGSTHFKKSRAPALARSHARRHARTSASATRMFHNSHPFVLVSGTTTASSSVCETRANIVVLVATRPNTNN